MQWTSFHFLARLCAPLRSVVDDWVVKIVFPKHARFPASRVSRHCESRRVAQISFMYYRNFRFCFIFQHNSGAVCRMSFRPFYRQFRTDVAAGRRVRVDARKTCLLKTLALDVFMVGRAYIGYCIVGYPPPTPPSSVCPFRPIKYPREIAVGRIRPVRSLYKNLFNTGTVPQCWDLSRYVFSYPHLDKYWRVI